MKIQYRIALAQLPALVVLAVFWGLAQIALGSLGDASERILHENYRSVLAAQRMMEAAERLDSAALVRLAGRPDQADALIAAHRPVLEAELAVAEANITEEGEAEALAELRRRWGVYSADYQHFLSAPPDQRTSLYFDRLYPEFHALKEEANGILSLNQDAMVRKSDLAVTEAGRLRRQATLAGLVGLITAALAGLWAGTRLGEPYRRLSAAAERVAEGDLNLQVKEAGDLESIQVAHAFNRMISRLRAYRRASETEMVRTREAAQAAIDSLLDPVVVLAPGGELRLANRAARSLFDLAADARSLAGVHEALRLAIRKLAQ
ncbi:MAG TPA: HAMP domain-containing protein, partial [Myxococcota bacterium]|nr:HAMP domain-containing protein [Myxococcota bacterium]